MEPRIATLERKTTETEVSVRLNLDGTGQYQIDTGNGMLDHLLAQLSRHGLIDLTITAKGDVSTGWHHTVEDVSIVLGEAIHKALGERRGIVRTAHSYVPLDEALVLVVVDLSGRGYPVVEASLSDIDLGDLPADLVRHCLETLAREARMNMHAKVLAGINNHHKAEALFKALARALRQAIRIDERAPSDIPSTKGTIG